MRYLFFLIFLSNILYAQELSLGLSTNLTPTVQEYLINANREIATHDNKFISYGIGVKVHFSNFQSGILIKYGTKKFTDDDIVFSESEEFDFFEQKAERKIDQLRIEIPILFKIYSNDYSQIYLGATAGILNIRLKDKMNLTLDYVNQPEESGNFKDNLEKIILFIDPRIEGQFKLLRSMNLIFGLNYSFLDTDFHTKKEDEKSRIEVYETQYKYMFKGFYYSAGIYYNL